MTFQVKEKQWRQQKRAIGDGQRDSVLSVKKGMGVCQNQPELCRGDQAKVASCQGGRIPGDSWPIMLPDAGTGNDHDNPESCP